jgi:Family of unknown function (DUF5681)
MSGKSGSRKTVNPGWFSKGSSPNPGGRPRGSRAPQPSVLEIIMDETIEVAHRGGVREMTMEEALQQRTFQDALAGETMATREVIKWIKKRKAWLAKNRPKSYRPATSYRSPDPDNVDAALLLLGIAAPNPKRAEYAADRTPLLLEPWAVQAALCRRRGGNRLTDKERENIRRCTRDPTSLRWPRGTDE